MASIDSSIDYLITGAGGQLGRAVRDECLRRKRSAVGLSHQELAVEDAARVREQVARHRPRWVLHCAAWTDVDGCEREPDKALRINGEGAGHVAAACAAQGCGLVHVSTDFVFDGRKRTPYTETDEPRPISSYGASKLAGEQAVLRHAAASSTSASAASAAGAAGSYGAPRSANADNAASAASAEGARFYVLRTSWVYGPFGKSFPRAILARAREGKPLAVVEDEVGSPSMTRDLAPAMLDLCEREAPGGIYQASNEGVISRWQFAVDILREAGLGALRVEKIAARTLSRPAARPAYSALDGTKLARVRGNEPLPHYLDALRRYLKEELT